MKEIRRQNRKEGAIDQTFLQPLEPIQYPDESHLIHEKLSKLLGIINQQCSVPNLSYAILSQWADGFDI